MGVVWLGRHTEQDVPVAVKILKPRPRRSTAVNRKAFLQEVRAVSALDHPGVVWIFDSGVLPAQTARQAAAEGEDLAEGSPYLVMEYASRGTLRQLKRPPVWSELKAILLALLDALAHAHARGVLHRDLKPDNVLIAGHNDLRPGFKLTDFGIAHLLREGSPGEDRPIGTPQYMAPEQIRSETHLYGPHTDLYALGSMVWRVVTGRLPHHGLKGPSLMYAQLTKDPPPLEPLMAVPEGFEDFLRTLLRKAPHERFQRAADAAVALDSLPDPDAPAARALQLLDDEDRPLGPDTTATLKILIGRSPSKRKLDPSIRPPFPDTWRMPDTAPTRPLRLMGAGLGLFGIRPVPFVARDAERDVLWKALSEVHTYRSARVVVVRGGTGVGKSRLVSWVADRAHEVGAAHVLRATFSANAGPAPLRHALIRLLKSMTMSPADAAERFGRLLAGHGPDDGDIIDRFEILLDPERTTLHETRRDAIFRKIIEIVSEDRPVFAVLDDAHWSPDALRLANQLLDGSTRTSARVLLVLTVLEDPGDRSLSRRIQALLSTSNATELRLGVLDPRDHNELARELLGLDQHLADSVADGTGGNPLFAVQLVGDWVARGLLVVGPTGFLLEDPDQALPANLHEVWDERIRQLVRGLDAPSLQMLESAAVLGRDVDVLEWQAACDDPGGVHAAAGMLYFNPRHARLRQRLMDRLLASGLCQETEAGFSFVHAQFRDALQDRSRQAGRYREHTLTIARTLSTQIEGNQARIGRHLYDAGLLREAVAPLLAGADWALRVGGAESSLAMLQLVEHTLQQAALPEVHRHWAGLEVMRARAHRALGQPDEATRAAGVAIKRARSGGWVDLAAEAHSVLGEIALASDAQAQAEARFTTVVRLLEDDRDDASAVVRIRAWHQLWRIARRRGDQQGAQQAASRVREATSATNDPRARATGDVSLAENALAGARLEEARISAERSLAAFRQAGDLPGQARALDVLASVAEAQDHLSDARALLVQCIGCLEALSDPQLLLWRCRLAHVQARLGNFADARATLEPILADGGLDNPLLESTVHVCLAMAAAGLRRWSALGTHLDAAEASFEAIQTPDPAFAAAATLAGELALQHRRPEDTIRAWRLAQRRHQALGQGADAAKLRGRIARLQAPGKRS